jgi:hypothetical protein
MRFKMRKLFVVAVLAAAVSAALASRADAGCGPGCHMTWQGSCVVDGWGTVRNECPVPNRPSPPCPRYYSWRHGGCQAIR